MKNHPPPTRGPGHRDFFRINKTSGHVCPWSGAWTPPTVLVESWPVGRHVPKKMDLLQNSN